VIVKLAGIELTPQQPRYPGGHWHIEGLINEHIVATAIYYYDVENVTEAELDFCQQTWTKETSYDYEQNDYDALQTILDFDPDDDCSTQELGFVTSPQGRFLTWPNTMPHRVNSFELADKTIPGHRRFLVLWLVDPNYRVCSTRNVPPQQHRWWAEAASAKANFASRLPQETVDHIMKETNEWPMGMEEARRIRLELMKERTLAEDVIFAHMPIYNFCSDDF